VERLGITARPAQIAGNGHGHAVAAE
jgi:hypothetical protein